MTILSNTSVSFPHTVSIEFGYPHLVFRWDYILIFVLLKLVQGGGGFGTGLLNNLRTILWINVEQYTTREVQVQWEMYYFIERRNC